MKLMHTLAPILGVSERGEPTPIGTGILFRVRNEHFVLTAAHVLDENKHTTLYLPGNGEMIELIGHGRGSPAGADRQNDRHDSSYVHISNEISGRLNKDLWFLPPQFLDMDDVTSPEKYYLFTGYPHTAVKKEYLTRHIVSQLHSYTDQGMKNELYHELGLDSASHIAINFDAKRAKDANGMLVVPKDRRGMSGGGVWNGKDGLDSRGLPNTRLCGLAIEHHRDYRCLVGVKINLVVESIRHDFPELADFLPRSATLDVEIEDRDRKS